MGRYLFIILIFSLGCIETFNPDIDEAVDLQLVVDSQITDQLSTHPVLLTRASAIEGQNSADDIDNADVTIEDDQGNIINYEYVDNGNYIASNPFSGVIGRSYRLIINLNGNTYQSDFEELLPPATIDDLNARFEFRTVQSETGETTTDPFVIISADLSFPQGEAVYYRFDWSATYEALTPLQGSETCWLQRDQEPIDNLESGKLCYIQEQSKEFLKVFTSEDLNGNSIENVEIFSVDPNRRFQSLYSPEVVLYRITKTPYEFWQTVENQNNNVGGLFDPPPTPISGNIKNINDEEERVLGIFEVASVTRYRDFFPVNLVETELNNYSSDCSPSGGDFSPPPPPPISCCECTFLPNSTDVKPNYWIN